MAVTTLTATYAGLIVVDSGNTVGEINVTDTSKNTYSRRGSTDPLGERFLIQTPIIDREPGNGRGVYSQIRWSNIGYYCYVSGIGAGQSSGSVSISCQTGWNPDGVSSSGNYYNETWTVIAFSKDRNASMKSQSAEVRICEDETLWTSDVCSGPRIFGIDWN
ncbi:MAG: hypothetical protein RL441_699 [Actinomycetota bacterium]|jgi:hypothetical protein